MCLFNFIIDLIFKIVGRQHDCVLVIAEPGGGRRPAAMLGFTVLLIVLLPW